MDEEASGTAVSEQLLMNTEQVGVLLVSTLNTTNNETVKTISNQNIGMYVERMCLIISEVQRCVATVHTYMCIPHKIMVY